MFDDCTVPGFETCTHRWDRVATGRRHPSLHMDVRCLACPSDEYMSQAPVSDAILLKLSDYPLLRNGLDDILPAFDDLPGQL